MKTPDMLSQTEASIVGPFGMSDAFTNASLQDYKQMQDSIDSWNDREDPRFGNALEYFNNQEGLAGEVISSFLGRVATDTETLMEGISADDLSFSFYRLQIVQGPRPAGRLHRDCTNGFRVNARYLTTNHTPTLIPVLGQVRPGEIARMPLRRTEHQQPEFYAFPNMPRVLMTLDI
jgi:hypothetical protein